CSWRCFHAALEGHAASDGRRRLKVVLARRGRGKTGSSAADPIAVRNSLLFIRRHARARIGNSARFSTGIRRQVGDVAVELESRGTVTRAQKRNVKRVARTVDRQAREREALLA